MTTAFNPMEYDGDCELATKVPALSTIVDDNPDMYCNFAREEPKKLRCLTCRESCKHSGEMTLYVRAIDRSNE